MEVLGSTDGLFSATLFKQSVSSSDISADNLAIGAKSLANFVKAMKLYL
jgi:hypothetical protein